MSIFARMFKAPDHQRYEYKPRFYDPKKEELEDRIRQAARAKQGDKDAIKSRIKSKIRYNRDSRLSNKLSRRSNYMLFIIAVALFAIAYIALYIYLPRLEQILQ